MIWNQYRPALIASVATVLMAIAFSLFYLKDAQHFLQRNELWDTA